MSKVEFKENKGRKIINDCGDMTVNRKYAGDYKGEKKIELKFDRK